MFEKVNPSHPDKMADRIAGALVDMAYAKNDNPKIAVEVLLGHGKCHIIAETSEKLDTKAIEAAVERISGITDVDYVEVPQDAHLAENQEDEVRCGDNGIFKGTTLSYEEEELSKIARAIYEKYPTDGKYIIDGRELVVCQSNADGKTLLKNVKIEGYPLGHMFKDVKVNPLGDWTGGPDVDSGATNRKLGSDMGSSVTGGGLHGKDLSKADVSINIYAHLMAKRLCVPINFTCAIGDDRIKGIQYSEIVEEARRYINKIGGFEKFAEWGLI